MTKPKRRIGIVGSGLAGLTTAHLLCRHKDCEIVLFERAPCIGMDAGSITLDLAQVAPDSPARTGPCRIRIDSPMRAINDGSHARVKRLYADLEIPLERCSFSYSFAVWDNVVFLYNGRNGARWPPVEIPEQARHSWSQRAVYAWFVLCITLSYGYLLVLAFLYAALGLYDVRSDDVMSSRPRPHTPVASVREWTHAWQQQLASESLTEFAARFRLYGPFVEFILVPLFASVATCSRQHVAHNMPVALILQYIVSTFRTRHYVVKPVHDNGEAGIHVLVTKLIARVPPANLHLDTTIKSMEQAEGGRIKLTFTQNGDTSSDIFDDVVLATQANVACQFVHQFNKSLAASSPAQKQRESALSLFAYEESLVINHTDTSVLPKSLPDVKDLNMVLAASSGDGADARDNKQRTGPETDNEEPSDLSKHLSTNSSHASDATVTPTLKLGPGYVQATHAIHRTHKELLRHVLNINKPIVLLQTTNPIVDIDPAKILSHDTYTRIVVTRESRNVLPGFLFPNTDASRSSICAQYVSHALRHFLFLIDTYILGRSLMSPPQLPNAQQPTPRQNEFQGLDHIWFVGSWCNDGIPLLEGCVVSAENVVGAIVDSVHPK